MKDEKGPGPWDKCPGANDIRRPKPVFKSCPGCGADVEIWSDETEAKCDSCGRSIYNEINSCIKWCDHARECVGEEKYQAMTSV